MIENLRILPSNCDDETYDESTTLTPIISSQNYCPAGPPPTVQVKCVRNETTPDAINGTETTTIPVIYLAFSIPF